MYWTDDVSIIHIPLGGLWPNFLTLSTLQNTSEHHIPDVLENVGKGLKMTIFMLLNMYHCQKLGSLEAELETRIQMHEVY